LVIKMKTTFFIIDKFIHGNVRAQEFLDIALMAAAFDQRVVLLFEGEGVLALLKGQQVKEMGLKNVTPILSALPIYDINEILVEQESMKRWNIDETRLLIPVKVVAQADIKQQMNSADHVFSF